MCIKWNKNSPTHTPTNFRCVLLTTNDSGSKTDSTQLGHGVAYYVATLQWHTAIGYHLFPSGDSLQSSQSLLQVIDRRLLGDINGVDRLSLNEKLHFASVLKRVPLSRGFMRKEEDCITNVQLYISAHAQMACALISGTGLAAMAVSGEVHSLLCMHKNIRKEIIFFVFSAKGKNKRQERDPQRQHRSTEVLRKVFHSWNSKFCVLISLALDGLIPKPGESVPDVNGYSYSCGSGPARLGTD